MRVGHRGTFEVVELRGGDAVVELEDGARYFWQLWTPEAPAAASTTPLAAIAERATGVGRGTHRAIPSWAQQPGLDASRVSAAAPSAGLRTDPPPPSVQSIAAGRPVVSEAAGMQVVANAMVTASATLAASEPSSDATSGWEMYVDPATNLPWWWHEATGQSAWEPPTRAG